MKRLFLQIFAWLAILLGVGLMLQPTVSQHLAARQSTKTVRKFVQAAEAAAPAVAETTDNAEPARAYPELYDALQAYNAQIFAEISKSCPAADVAGATQKSPIFGRVVRYSYHS